MAWEWPTVSRWSRVLDIAVGALLLAIVGLIVGVGMVLWRLIAPHLH